MTTNLRIDIQSEEFTVRQFVDKSGKERSFSEQPAVVWCMSRNGSEPEAREIKVPVENGQPYPVGTYTLDIRSFFVDYKHFGRLALVPRLTPYPVNEAPF